MKKLHFLIFCAIIVFGCAKEEPLAPERAKDDARLNSKPVGYVMTMDEIRALALAAPSNYSPDPGTKSESKTIKDIAPLTSFDGIAEVRTRTADASPADGVVDRIYVVNYENDGGFAVISADNRLSDILAYSDMGNIPHDIAKIEVPGVIAFLKALPDYAERETERVAALLNDYHPYPDSLPDADGYYRMNYRTEYGPWTDRQSGPVLTTQWDQGRPYNRLLPFCYTHQSQHSTGCVATALAQIMAYHRYPTTVHSDKLDRDVTLNWNSILSAPMLTTGNSTSADIEAVSALMEVIGNKVNTIYTCSGSPAYSSDVPRALFDMGYTCDNLNYLLPSNTLQDYDTRKVCEKVISFPVYISGSDPSEDMGHAWVIDGDRYKSRPYLEVWDVYDIDMNLVRTESRTMYSEMEYSEVHCNWGWGSKFDGFFASGVFDVGVSSFTNHLKVITGIRPR